MPRATKSENLYAKAVLLTAAYSDEHRASLRVVDSFNEWMRENNKPTFDRLSNDVSFLAACALEIEDLRFPNA